MAKIGIIQGTLAFVRFYLRDTRRRLHIDNLQQRIPYAVCLTLTAGVPRNFQFEPKEIRIIVDRVLRVGVLNSLKNVQSLLHLVFGKLSGRPKKAEMYRNTAKFLFATL